jgi:hypothetical protein
MGVVPTLLSPDIMVCGCLFGIMQEQKSCRFHAGVANTINAEQDAPDITILVNESQTKST